MLLRFLGFPHTSVYSDGVMVVAAGEVCEVSIEKAAQLQKDFPTAFVAVEEERPKPAPRTTAAKPAKDASAKSSPRTRSATRKRTTRKSAKKD